MKDYFKILNIRRDEGEDIIHIVYRHAIFMIEIFLIFIVGFVIIPAAIYFFIQTIQLPESVDLLEQPYRGYLVLVGAIYLLAVLLYCYALFIDYVLDVGVITNKRVLDIEQHGLFGKKVIQIYLENIQDVSSAQKGVIQSVLNYGNVIIQSAGERTNFEWHNVPKPTETAELLLDIRSDANGSGSGKINASIG